MGLLNTSISWVDFLGPFGALHGHDMALGRGLSPVAINPCTSVVNTLAQSTRSLVQDR
jgi:hypothetical protein